MVRCQVFLPPPFPVVFPAWIRELIIVNGALSKNMPHPKAYASIKILNCFHIVFQRQFINVVLHLSKKMCIM